MKQNGFTLIELIVVIIVIAILAVTALPRLSDQNDFAEVTQRDQLLGLLRTVQQRAMQNSNHTTDPACYRILFQANAIGLAVENTNGTCDINLVDANTANTQHLRIDQVAGYTAQNSDRATSVVPAVINFSQITFNNLGSPILDNGDCIGTECLITIGTSSVCIESEGYIHVCD